MTFYWLKGIPEVLAASYKKNPALGTTTISLARPPLLLPTLFALVYATTKIMGILKQLNRNEEPKIWELFDCNVLER